MRHDYGESVGRATGRRRDPIFQRLALEGARPRDFTLFIAERYCAIDKARIKSKTKRGQKCMELFQRVLIPKIPRRVKGWSGVFEKELLCCLYSRNCV